MKPEQKEILDDLANIAIGLNTAIENVAISKRPCELRSFYVNTKDKTITDKIVSSTLTKLLVSGLYSELRGMERYITRRMEAGQTDKDEDEEILERLRNIMKLI